MGSHRINLALKLFSVFTQKDVNMSYSITEKFRKKLDSLPNSDYYGLKSHGTTCYLNSVLQVLFMTRDFREAVKRCRDQDPAAFDLHLASLFADLEKCTADPHNITKELEITDLYEQRDAAEYFEKILSLTNPEATQMFKGQLMHRNTCSDCGKCTASQSFFWTLPLTLEHRSVSDALEAFFKAEKVSGDDKMYCDQCDEKKAVTIECEITHPPEILTLLLKRFRFDLHRMCYVKVNRQIEVPQILEEKLFRQDCTYDLYAVVNHVGSLKGGHYTAEIKSYENEGWYLFSDAKVRMAKQPPITRDCPMRSSVAYLLMYRKVTRQDYERVNEANWEPYLANSDAVATESGEDICAQTALRDNSRERRKKIKQKCDMSKDSGDDLEVKKHIREQRAGRELTQQMSWRRHEPATCASPHEKMISHIDSGLRGAGNPRLELKGIEDTSLIHGQRKVERGKAAASNVKKTREVSAAKPEEQISHKDHQKGNESMRCQYERNSKERTHRCRTPEKRDKLTVAEKISDSPKNRKNPKVFPSVACERESGCAADNKNLHDALRNTTHSGAARTKFGNLAGSKYTQQTREGGVEPSVEKNRFKQEADADFSEQVPYLLAGKPQSRVNQRNHVGCSHSSISESHITNSSKKEWTPGCFTFFCAPTQNVRESPTYTSKKEKSKAKKRAAKAKPPWR
ncbi:ubiquitin carboxyl-terminal hydrolase 17-like protein E [Myripristis murdjan]|uniref:ubiquitin carboxyl-terminal hydrolase 17-like protein E n=1 Tax=Myripristis murdjan TaxID=586833 RepID=UPI00117616BC|nr:ubiquitin carboxyl-terminal hydrolase 17-like protein E [Myripristis murdjan]